MTEHSFTSKGGNLLDTKDLQIEILTQTIGQLYKDLAEIKAALIIERNRTAKLAQEVEQFSGKNVDTEELMK